MGTTRPRKATSRLASTPPVTASSATRRRWPFGAATRSPPSSRGEASPRDAIVAHALALLAEHRKRKLQGIPRIAVDVEGGIGTRVFAKLRVAVESRHIIVDLVAVRGGKKFWGSPEFDMIRDGLWGQTRDWLLAGGAIPTDVQLSQELNAPIFTADKNQRYVATDKKALRKILGRSPDRADAACLSVWGFASVDRSGSDHARAGASNDTDDDDRDDDVDVYEDAGRTFNPYGKSR